MLNVLITDPISENGIKILEDKGINIFYNPDSDLNDIKKIIQTIDGWIIRSGTKIDADLISEAKQLKFNNLWLC